ncbi:O-methyltransferase asqD [Pseudocercospora fuligena]|uniref:O-methyltransferase asqD n=1 Tax=Pseudocercospora fuligena TaxID=685502 RepID=A0A8H6RKR2_9PEZI|nr:O-methyltransferase asqD [Pseudocercospora fuligena]
MAAKTLEIRPALSLLDDASKAKDTVTITTVELEPESEVVEIVPKGRDAVAITQELQQLSAAIAQHDEQAQAQALSLARELTATLTNPPDRAMEIIFTPFVSSAVQSAVRMGIFEVLAKRQGCTMATSEVAKSCAAEELLVGRILRLLAGMQFVQEDSRGSWKANETTQVMASPAMAAGHRFVWDIQMEGTIKSPQYLEESGFVGPTEPTNGFIQYANRTKLDVFEYMAKVRPDRLRDFHLFMGNTGTGPYWVDWFPVQEQLLAGYDGQSPLLVDLGGGKGHDILSFANNFPSAPDQLILQDIEPALATISVSDRDPRITYMAQDFFAPNQVVGARTYFLHHIFHDWSDKYALKILSHLRHAMKPGYSKLLIHDLILPDEGTSQYLAAWDMVMMTFNAGIERSRQQWEALLQKAGFRIEGFWFGQQGDQGDGILQAVVDVQ